jgi:hypothetical protein
VEERAGGGDLGSSNPSRDSAEVDFSARGPYFLSRGPSKDLAGVALRASPRVFLKYTL